MNKNKIIVAVTGASGAVYTKLLLKKLTELKVPADDCALIFSQNARSVWSYELPDDNIDDIPYPVFRTDDFFAPVASGSAGYKTMIICPCTMGTLGRIASGVSNDLITRAADVILKERKKLILVTREMPLNLIHINNMKTVTEAGGIICPAAPSFYSKPSDIEEILGTVINKILALAEIETDHFHWGEH
jgi:flavin prenyltransferase